MTRRNSTGRRAAAVLALGVMFAACGQGQNRGRAAKEPLEGPEHFRWSEAKARALNQQHTIGSAADLRPDQKEALIGAVVRQLKSHRSLDEFFAGMPERELRDLAANTRVERVDLNRDGRPDIIAQASGLGPCGGTGNCIVWIFQMNAAKPRLLLDSFDNEAGFEVITVRPWTTNGFKDIVLGTHDSATERDLVWYQYAGGGYRRKSCFHMKGLGDPKEALENPAISPVNCTDIFAPKKQADPDSKHSD